MNRFRDNLIGRSSTTILVVARPSRCWPKTLATALFQPFANREQAGSHNLREPFLKP
jgi:hypothetical protein